MIEVIVRNPTPEDITLMATIQGRDLSGPESITLAAGGKDVYTLTYAPAIIGKSKGRWVQPLTQQATMLKMKNENEENNRRRVTHIFFEN